LYTIRNYPQEFSDFRCTISNLLGSIQDAAFDPNAALAADRVYTSFDSTLRQSFDAIANQFLRQDYTRQQTIVPINITPPVFTHPHPNPYDICLAYTPNNFNELQTVLSSVASVLTSAVPCNVDLARIFTTNSGKDILLHGYSSFALPTWHSQQYPAAFANLDPETIERQVVENLDSAVNTAAYLNFLIEPNQDADEHDHEFEPFHPVCETNAAHAVTPYTPAHHLYLLSHRDVADPPVRVPPLDDFRIYDDDNDLNPLLAILEPTESNKEIAWKASAFGMIIESFEIDGTSVPHPNAEAPLASENACFFQSAIPYDSVRPSYFFNQGMNQFARVRMNEHQRSFKAATILIDYSRICIPRPLRNVIANFVDDGIPGFTLLNHVNWLAQVTRFLGFRAESTTHRDQPDRLPPHVEIETLHLWSPYSYTPVTPHLNNVHHITGHLQQRNRGYFISNLRTMFGTDPQLIELQHAYKSMPLP
jgi:hypothetical protein